MEAGSPTKRLPLSWPSNTAWVSLVSCTATSWAYRATTASRCGGLACVGGLSCTQDCCATLIMIEPPTNNFLFNNITGPTGRGLSTVAQSSVLLTRVLWRSAGASMGAAKHRSLWRRQGPRHHLGTIRRRHECWHPLAVSSFQGTVPPSHPGERLCTAVAHAQDVGRRGYFAGGACQLQEPGSGVHEGCGLCGHAGRTSGRVHRHPHRPVTHPPSLHAVHAHEGDCLGASNTH